MTGVPRSRLWAWTAAAVLLTTLLVLVVRGEIWSLAADPYAGYFPSARDLLDGKGLDAFAPLHRGQARMPMYSVLVALAGTAAPSLQVAAQGVNIAAWLGTSLLIGLAALRLGWGRAVPFILLALVNPHVTKATADALPDAVFALSLAAFFYAIVHTHLAPRPRAFFWLGIIAALPVLVRFNGVGVIGLPLALLLFGREPRRRNAATVMVGLAVGLIPLFVLIVYLEAHGISYPNLYIKSSNLAGKSAVDAGSVLWSGLKGVVALPARLASSGAPLWVVAAALPAVILGVWKHPRRETFRVLGITFLFLVGAVLPIHHEPRFQLPFVPFWWTLAGLTFVHLTGRLLSRLKQTNGWTTPAAAATLAGVLSLPFGVAAILEQRQARIEIEREAVATCYALSRLGKGEPVAVGVPPNKFQYHWLRGCQLILGLPVAVLPMNVETRGVALLLRYGAEGSDTLVSFPAAMGPLSLVMTPTPLVGTVVDSNALGAEPVLLPLPRGIRRRGCGTLAVLRPSEPLRVVVATPLTNALELTLHTDSGPASKYLLWSAGGTRRFELPAPDGPTTSIDYCVANPIRADGVIAFAVTPGDP